MERTRERMPGRLEAFVDAAFAFAVTLLIVWNNDLPDSIESLTALLKTMPSYAASFGLITWFWWAHVAWCKRSQLNNRATILLNLLLVFLVLIYMFPLRLMFGELFSGLTNGWLPSPFAQELDTQGLVTLLAIYGLAVTSMSACIAGLYVQTLRERHELDLTRQDILDITSLLAVYGWYTAAGIFALLCLAVFLLLGVRNSSVLFLTTIFYFLAFFNSIIQARARKTAGRMFDTQREHAGPPPEATQPPLKE
jgi:uncharacterized membrane protein